LNCTLGIEPTESIFHSFKYEFDRPDRTISPVMRIDQVITKDVVCVDMDVTLGNATELCSGKKIRHLPVLDENKRLAGIITDRDIRYFLSPRLGTISENNSDRESLSRRVHQVMIRHVVCATENTSLSEAAGLMLANRVGCLPVVDADRHVIGIITTTDLIRYIAKNL
jgi:acetoin utilization protein AcuB